MPIKPNVKRRMGLEEELLTILTIITKNHMKRRATATAELKQLCKSTHGDSRRAWIAYRLEILLKRREIERTVFGFYKLVEKGDA